MDFDPLGAVKVLNGLIETTLDSAHGYEEAAKNAEDGQLRALFAARSRRRLDLARQLQQEVRTFGGEPEEGRSLLGRAHDSFVELKTALTGGRDQKALIDEVERGEDVIKARFETAMSRDELPSTALEAVTRAYEAIRADHDEISRLKHTLH